MGWVKDWRFGSSYYDIIYNSLWPGKQPETTRNNPVWTRICAYLRARFSARIGHGIRLPPSRCSEYCPAMSRLKQSRSYSMTQKMSVVGKDINEEVVDLNSAGKIQAGG